jgi:hypothetical protein
MSPRDTFWFLAGALVAFAILLTARAWLHAPAAQAPSEPPAAVARATLPAVVGPVAAAFGLIAVALGIYFLIGSPASIVSERMPAAAAADNASGLLMPGDQQITVADVAAAGAARTNPVRTAPANAGSLDDVTQYLAKRLAASGGTDDEWRLLAQSYEYMGRTDEARAARMHTTAAETPAATAKAAATPSASAAQLNHAAADGAAGSRISGTVRIAADLASSAAPGTTLFIYATDPAAPGPPLAVLRLRVDRWPVSFVLDDADAMIPGRNLSASKSVRLEARISPSGEALPRAGDLVGNIAEVDPHATRAVDISIDHKIG